MDFKIIIFGLFLIGLGGSLIWGSINNNDYSIGDKIVVKTIRKYDRSIVSQNVREYGVIDWFWDTIPVSIFGIIFIWWGVYLIKEES